MHFGWSQARLGMLLHLPQQAVSAWEGDRWEPSVPLMAALTQLFGVTEEALRTGKGFHLPDAPGVFMAAEEQTPQQPVSLPPGDPGKVWEVSINTNQRRSVTVDEAIALIRKASDEGKSLWVLIRDVEVKRRKG